jgi:hypothetical protein
VNWGNPVLVLGLSVLMLVGTLCWCWRERSRRKSIKEIERERRETFVALLREYGKLPPTRRGATAV